MVIFFPGVSTEAFLVSTLYRSRDGFFNMIFEAIFYVLRRFSFSFGTVFSNSYTWMFSNFASRPTAHVINWNKEILFSSLKTESIPHIRPHPERWGILHAKWKSLQWSLANNKPWLQRRSREKTLVQCFSPLLSKYEDVARRQDSLLSHILYIHGNTIASVKLL